jgi:hypothetical protein
MTQSHESATDRCQHLTNQGRRCRLAAQPDSRFCARHEDPAQAGIETDLLTAFADGKESLACISALHDFLGRLLVLQVQNRISPRRAAVMAYNVNLMLRTVLTAARNRNAAKTSRHPVVEYVFPGTHPRDPSPSSGGSSTQ